MKAFFEKIFYPNQNVSNLNVLRKLFFLYTIVSFVQLIPFIPQLYSSNFSIIYQRELSAITLSSLVNLLAINSLKDSYWWFFALQILFSILGLLGYFTRLSTFLVWCTTINLQNRIYSTNTGGDLLLNILFFYLIFVSDGKSYRNIELEKIRNTIDYFVSFLCKSQIVIIYLISAIYKVSCAEWLNGTALQRILFVKDYSLPIVSQAANNYSFIFALLTWIILLYQLLFPLVLIKSNKTNYFLFIGVLMHLGIALFMGLFNFSIIMIFSYVLFVPLSRLEKLPLLKKLI